MALAPVLILALASVLVMMARAFKHPAIISLPARSLVSTSRRLVTGSVDTEHAVTASGETEESKKARRRESNKKYYAKNRVLIIEKVKEYREVNSEAIDLYSKAYYEENRDAISRRKKIYYEENKDEIKENREERKDDINQYNKEYYKENKDFINLRKKIYYEENKVTLNQQRRLYREENRDALKQSRKLKREQNRDAIDRKKKAASDLKREKSILSLRRDLAQHPTHAQHLLSDEEHDTLYDTILHEKRKIFKGRTLAQAVASGRWTFYFSASLDPGAEQNFQWLTTKAIKESPVLLMADGTRIEDKFLRSHLGAVGGVLHSSRLVFNELQLLWRLQEAYCHLPLGHGRLNRKVGPTYKAEDGAAVCSLYFICFPVTKQSKQAKQSQPLDTVQINGIPLLINR
ncbi:hypothetical protein B484DRAFT_452762 [Ochromonadaceae sp. CCMP2298]|nr:hypothetical protein B484DRAFT_452762 [Ochromonadaceae sp. CCMP2298]